MQPGTLVKPVGRARDGTWRLGVVESALEDGRFMVKAIVAPEGAYAGSASAYRPDELEVVPRREVEGALQVVRARIAKEQQLERQIAAALEAANR